MFKVGQEVWIKELKQFGKIDKIEKPMLFDNYYINGNEYTQAELHQTAHDMFVELGYEKTEPLAHIIRYTHNNDNYIININFNLSKQVYYVDNHNGVACGILKNEHLAIHQKMIELGWL